MHKVKAGLILFFLYPFEVLLTFFVRATSCAQKLKSSNHTQVLLLHQLRYLSSYIFQRIMTMLSIFLREEYLRLLAYPELIFFFFFFLSPIFFSLIVRQLQFCSFILSLLLECSPPVWF